MSRDEVRAAHAAALKRHEGRRQEYRSQTEAERRQAWLEARELPRMDLYAPEFRPPSTAAEFFDDRIITHSALAAFPETPVLVAIAAAAREGEDAAVKAVAAARGLDRAVQWVVYQNLGFWRKHEDAAKTGADALVLRVEREWERLKLATGDPDDE